MEEVRLSEYEALTYILIPAGIGFLLGLVPLVLGFIKQKVRLGVFGLIASTLGGAVLGVILSIPAMAVFTWIIIRDGFVAEEAVSPRTSDGPNEGQD